MGVFKKDGLDIAWCSGCGNFGILQIVQNALDELGKKPSDVVLVSGIGQAAKLPQYVHANMFNGLHGRALPVATGVKAANPKVDVVVTSGDGDMYGEGGNHFIHTIRRNPNITVIVHNNMIYGLTKGQASPTTEKGVVTPVQTTGVTLEPFNPLAVAVSLDTSFVARANIGDMKEAKEIIKKAIAHEGFALVDLFQPCITFNKVNTYSWFKENTYYLDDDYNCHDRKWAFEKAIQTDKFPLGIIYISPDEKKLPFEKAVGTYTDDSRALFERTFDMSSKNKLRTIMGQKKPVHNFCAKVLSVVQETSDVKTFELERPDGFVYKAGQYVMVGFSDKHKVAEKVTIPLTLSSSPTEDTLRITVKEMHGFTKELFSVVVGDELSIQGPLGECFNVTEGFKENVGILSAGTGITPFISILRFMKAKGMRNNVAILNANKTYDDIIFRDELDSFSAMDTVSVMNSLDTHGDDWKGEHGFICKEKILKHVSNIKERVWMICGPPAMVKTTEDILLELGVDKENIKRDNWELPSKG